jgi:enamine deaminase RidA (YjgF/YER057c/UK114 family)
MSVRYANPVSMHKPPGYTHVVVAAGPGQTIYLSGQVGITPDGKLAGADFHSQTIQLFENMKSALAEAGARFENVIKFNVYVTDVASQLAPWREIRDQYVNVSTPPASTLVQVPRLALDGLLVEVEAIAFVPAG